MKEVIIGNTKYKTIKECNTKVKAKLMEIYLIGESTINQQNPNFIFLMDLFNKHPYSNEKIGVGIDKFFITHNIGIDLQIKRYDGTIDNFGWGYCTGAKKFNNNTMLIQAMRNSIKTLSYNFKINNELICAICKVIHLDFKDYGTDHKTIPFSVISTNFINKNPQYKTLSFYSPIEGSHYFIKEDKELEQMWYDYHLQHSDFQILCDSCNARKGNRY
jgi:hypothetical protein